MAGLGKASDTGSGWGVSPEARAQKLLKGRATSVATPASGGGGCSEFLLRVRGPRPRLQLWGSLPSCTMMQLGVPPPPWVPVREWVSTGD